MDKMNIFKWITRNTNEVNRSSPSSADFLRNIHTNPLLIDLVLENVFSWSDYKTLKQCRLVCVTWKNIIDPMFSKRSVLVLKKRRKKSFESVLEFGIELDSLIKRMATESGITGFNIELSAASRLLQIIDHSLITHLEIYNASRHWYILDYFIGPNLQTLIIKSYIKEYLLVSLKSMEKLSRIDLEYCIILVNSEDDCKISPIELKLVNIARKLNRRLSPEINLNEFVNFNRLEKLWLENRDTKYILILSDCVTVQCLSLVCTTVVLNDEKSISPKELTLENNNYVTGQMQEISEINLSDYFKSSHFDKLDLNQTNVILDFGLPISIGSLTLVCRREIKNSNPTADQMKIRKLKLYGYFSYYLVIDLCLLPSSIETLHMRMRSITCSGPLSFPKLKQLVIHGEIKCMPHFINCPSLADISLGKGHYIEGGQFARDIQQLPPSTKRIIICCCVYGIVQRQPHNLEVLVISDNCDRRLTSDFQFALSRTKLTANLIVLHYNDNGSKDYQQRKLPGKENRLFLKEKNIRRVMEIKRSITGEQSIAVGPVKWKSRVSFLKCRISVNIDQMAEYYLIQGAALKAISRNEFDRWATFGNN